MSTQPPSRRITDRFSLAAPTLEGRNFEEVRFQLQQWLEVATSIFDGLGTKGEEGGFDAFAGLTVPEPIEAGDVGNIGNPANGFAPIDHEHPVTTGAPIGLANTNVMGTSIALPRADHQHKRDVRVKVNGVDLATRNALDFRTSGGAVADDLANDEVDVPIASPDDAANVEYLAWVL